MKGEMIVECVAFLGLWDRNLTTHKPKNSQLLTFLVEHTSGCSNKKFLLELGSIGLRYSSSFKSDVLVRMFSIFKAQLVLD
jgi:hypothetical protein